MLCNCGLVQKKSDFWVLKTRNRKCLCAYHYLYQLKWFLNTEQSYWWDTTGCWFSASLTSYLLINHIPSDVWGGDGWSDRYVCSSVPVSLLPEGQTTSLEMRKRTAHVTHTHSPTWAHYCDSREISARLGCKCQSGKNLSKQQEKIPANNLLHRFHGDGNCFDELSCSRKHNATSLSTGQENTSHKFTNMNAWPMNRSVEKP